MKGRNGQGHSAADGRNQAPQEEEDLTQRAPARPVAATKPFKKQNLPQRAAEGRRGRRRLAL